MATGLVGVFILLLIATGFASAAVVGAAGIGAVDPSGQSSPILLAAGVLRDGSTGRVVLITLMACVIFLAVLTTVTSVTFFFAAAVSFAHDVFARGRRRRTETGEIRALRAGAVIVGAVGLSLAAAIHRYPTDFLVLSRSVSRRHASSPHWSTRSSGAGSTAEDYCGPFTAVYCSAPSSRLSRPSSREPCSRCGRKHTSTGIRSRPQAWFPYLQRSFSGGSAASAHPRIPNASFAACSTGS
ncbi:hypothetical protein [Streptomyces sp. NPDC006510]|uniref:hypothetical protein n=1 Tax=Streptomyces sp. NPDC006510 TaxID=3155600 RepID=UPI0033AA0DB9